MKVTSLLVLACCVSLGRALSCQTCDSVLSCQNPITEYCPPSTKCYTVRERGEVKNKGCTQGCFALTFGSGDETTCTSCNYDNCNAENHMPIDSQTTPSSQGAKLFRIHKKRTIGDGVGFGGGNGGSGIGTGVSGGHQNHGIGSGASQGHQGIGQGVSGQNHGGIGSGVSGRNNHGIGSGAGVSGGSHGIGSGVSDRNNHGIGSGAGVNGGSHGIGSGVSGQQQHHGIGSGVQGDHQPHRIGSGAEGRHHHQGIGQGVQGNTRQHGIGEGVKAEHHGVGEGVQARREHGRNRRNSGGQGSHHVGIGGGVQPGGSSGATSFFLVLTAAVARILA